MISKEQQRAEFALARIQEAMTSGSGRVPEDFANFIVGTPTMILQNGLGQTMAFLLSKCKGREDVADKHFFTFRAIARWCERENSQIQSRPMDFLQAVTQLHQGQYLTLQEEALKMLQWLKRYAKAFQEVKPDATHH